MDIKSLFFEGTIIFLLIFVLGVIVCLVGKHEKGEFDWKEFGKWTIYALVLAIAGAAGFAFRGGR